jgi:hypothetical protein
VKLGDRGPLLRGLFAFAIDSGGPFEELALPTGNLVGMDVIALGDLDHRLFALDRLQGDFGFESRRMVAPRPSPHT